MVNSKHAFWQALVLTVVIFIFGFLLGYLLDFSRADDVQYNLLNSEINLLDEQLREKVIGDFNISCEVKRESIFDFADKIYSEAIKLESYESASLSDDSFDILHRRYDLLRMLLWTQAIEIKKECGDNFHTVVYFYEYGSNEIEVNSKQMFSSRLLRDLKDRNPEKIILIPIATNMDLGSVNLALGSYNITSFPTILVDEKIVIDEILTLEDMEKTILDSNKQFKAQFR